MRRFSKAILMLSIAAALWSVSTRHALAQNSVRDDGDQLEATLRSVLPDLPAEALTRLVDDGEVTNLYETPQRSTLAPAFAHQIQTDLDELHPRLGVELLVLQPEAGTHSASLAQTFTTLQSISAMEGIQYFSISRDRVRTLYYDSYIIADPDSRARIPDPVWDIAPESDRLYVYQRDSTFGKNVYQVDYAVDGDAIMLTMRNLSRMYYGGVVPTLAANKLLIHIIVMPVGDHVLFYGGSAADPIGVFGMEERARDSFYNRIVALRGWYLDQHSRLRTSDR